MIGLRCHRCKRVNLYENGDVIKRGCDHCCCDWFCTFEECPAVVDPLICCHCEKPIGGEAKQGLANEDYAPMCEPCYDCMMDTLADQ